FFSKTGIDDRDLKGAVPYVFVHLFQPARNLQGALPLAGACQQVAVRRKSPAIEGVHTEHVLVPAQRGSRVTFDLLGSGERHVSPKEAAPELKSCLGSGSGGIGAP